MTPTHCPRCGNPVAAGLRFCTECGTPLTPPPVPSAPAVPPASAQPGCPRCGQPVASGLRFCTNCGTPLAGPAPVPTPTQTIPTYVAPTYATPAPAPEQRPDRRLVWPWVLAVVIVLGLVGGGLALLLTRDDSDGSTTSADRGSDRADAPADDVTTDAPEETESDAPEPEESEDAEVTAPPTTTTSAPPVGATCWDGTTASTVDLCSRPQGPSGVEWVFPSILGQDCANLSGSAHAPGRKVLIQCIAALGDGTPIKLNYSQWGAVDNAREYYEDKLVENGSNAGAYRFEGYANDGQANVAVLYGKEPFSVSVYAPTLAQVDEALAALVQARPPAEVRGDPVG